MTDNKPYPRGEILLSGGNVCEGYYNSREKIKTNEDFLTIDGRRWFATGDIGEVNWDGTLKIIGKGQYFVGAIFFELKTASCSDRKKDLIKLQHGEYVSLSKVESTLLTHPLVDNVCMYGNSLKHYMIALIVPNEKCLLAVAKKVTSSNRKSGFFQKMFYFFS